MRRRRRSARSWLLVAILAATVAVAIVDRALGRAGLGRARRRGPGRCRSCGPAAGLPIAPGSCSRSSSRASSSRPRSGRTSTVLRPSAVSGPRARHPGRRDRAPRSCAVVLSITTGLSRPRASSSGRWSRRRIPPRPVDLPATSPVPGAARDACRDGEPRQRRDRDRAVRPRPRAPRGPRLGGRRARRVRSVSSAEHGPRGAAGLGSPPGSCDGWTIIWRS